jgi:CheY-like chemotaxis protein
MNKKDVLKVGQKIEHNKSTCTNRQKSLLNMSAIEVKQIYEAYDLENGISAIDKLENKVCRNNFHILLVDDDRNMRYIVKEWLKRSGFIKIHEAQNGEEALEIIKEYKIDIVLSDYRMPIMDGRVLWDKIQHLKDSPYYVLVSGVQNQNEFDNLKKHGIIVLPKNNYEDDEDITEKIQKLTLAYYVKTLRKQLG